MSTERISVKAKVEKDGSIWLPLPANLVPVMRPAWAGMLLLASQSGCQVGVARNGEILLRKIPLIGKRAGK